MIFIRKVHILCCLSSFLAQSSKTLEVFWEERHKGVSCCVSEVMFGPEDGAAGCWEIRSPAPSPDRGEGRGWRLNQSVLANDFIQCAYVRNPPKNPERMRSRELWVSEHEEIQGDSLSF